MSLSPNTSPTRSTIVYVLRPGGRRSNTDPQQHLSLSDPQPRYPMRGWGAVEDRRPRSRLVDGHTHTHSVLTTPGLHLRSFVPLRRGFAKTVLQRRGFALHPQP